MHIIKLNLKERSYDIIVGFDIINLLGEYLNNLDIGSYAYVITNARIKNKYGNALIKTLKASGLDVRLKVIPDTEKSKSIGQATSVIKDIAHFDKRKSIFIVAFGGGVVGDLSGFIASIYKRGVPYIQIPTTILAQVDSSIGGKTAVDLFEGKNMVGAFYQPRLVFSDIKLLASLNPRQIRAGIAEVIKYAIIKDKQLFTHLEKRYKDIFALKPGALEYIVTHCSRIKSDIVSRDERDNLGLRAVLNFGHTVGHAIETAGKFKMYNHGEAIALGMLVASDISRSLKLTDNTVLNRIKNLIKAVGLPLKIKEISLSEIINAHYRDKKFIGSKNRFVLICGIGKAKIVENIPLRIIKEAIKKRT
jgi:3-dehydroquinate synthase